MGLSIQTQVGAQTLSNGSSPSAIRQERTGALVTQDVHAPLTEATLTGNVYSGGMTLTSISNATFSTGTLTASCTPIIGLYNPLGSGKNLVIITTKLTVINTALQMTGAGAFIWCTSTGNGAISTGNNPMNRLTLISSGSVAKDMSGVALTGLTNNLTVRSSSGFSSHLSNVSTLQTAAGLMPVSAGGIDHLDGSFIVPPGGVLALLCTTNPPVAVSAASVIVWEEISI